MTDMSLRVGDVVFLPLACEWGPPEYKGSPCSRHLVTAVEEAAHENSYSQGVSLDGVYPTPVIFHSDYGVRSRAVKIVRVAESRKEDGSSNER